MIREKAAPTVLAAMFAFALALPAVGMIIAGLMMGDPGLGLIGFGLFVAIISLYFVIADIVFWHNDEMGAH